MNKIECVLQSIVMKCFIFCAGVAKQLKAHKQSFSVTKPTTWPLVSPTQKPGQSSQNEQNSPSVRADGVRAPFTTQSEALGRKTLGDGAHLRRFGWLKPSTSKWRYCNAVWKTDQQLGALYGEVTSHETTVCPNWLKPDARANTDGFSCLVLQCLKLTLALNRIYTLRKWQPLFFKLTTFMQFKRWLC